jgi:hypothetical protein
LEIIKQVGHLISVDLTGRGLVPSIVQCKNQVNFMLRCSGILAALHRGALVDLWDRTHSD